MNMSTFVSKVLSFLEMISHYRKFIPHLHQMKQPLEELNRKNRFQSWNRTRDLAAEQIKKVTFSPLLLEYYDSKKILIAADVYAIISALFFYNEMHTTMSVLCTVYHKVSLTHSETILSSRRRPSHSLQPLNDFISSLFWENKINFAN